MYLEIFENISNVYKSFLCVSDFDEIHGRIIDNLEEGRIAKKDDQK